MPLQYLRVARFDSFRPAACKSVTPPINPSVAVVAVMVHDISELRMVCTASTSVPCWLDTACSQSCRNWSCKRVARAGRSHCFIK